MVNDIVANFSIRVSNFGVKILLKKKRAIESMHVFDKIKIIIHMRHLNMSNILPFILYKLRFKNI